MRKRSQPTRVHFEPKNPGKYKGGYPIVCRSRWEVVFCRWADLSESIVEWMSEPYSIPYRDPITGNQKLYVPDFLVTGITPSGGLQTKLVEVKPMSETLEEHAISQRDNAMLLRNKAKWLAAAQWCERRGIAFEVITEREMFGSSAPKRRRKKR